jgi:hypothetical protein
MASEVTPVYLERGSKRAFACSLEWPGWCRSGRTSEAALEALAEYADRYSAVAAVAGLSFPFSTDPEFSVTETVAGSSTTDFGAPDAVPEGDHAPLDAAEAARQVTLLGASWTVLEAIASVTPAELRKGPRGGGRDRDKMLEHVLGAEAAYARKIGVRHRSPSLEDTAAIQAMRADITTALSAPWHGEPLATKGWPPRYALRRLAWHVLDHAWEMEDRTELNAP